MDTSHTSLLLECSETDPLAPKRRNQNLEGEITDHSSSPDAMGQDDELGHGKYPDRGLTSDTGATPGRISDFHSEEMDTTAQPSEVESYSNRIIESQDMRYAHSGLDSRKWEKVREKVRQPGVVDCIPGYNPM